VTEISSAEREKRESFDAIRKRKRGRHNIGVVKEGRGGIYQNYWGTQP